MVGALLLADGPKTKLGNLYCLLLKFVLFFNGGSKPTKLEIMGCLGLIFPFDEYSIVVWSTANAKVGRRRGERGRSSRPC